MCRRYSFFTSPELAGRPVNARPVDFFPWEPRYTALPGNWMPAITNEFPNIVQFFRWGLTPQWAKDDKMGLGMYNTGAEKIREKPAYEKIFQYKRCAVLADGWYFLPTVRDKKNTTALRFHLPGNAPLYFAGLWDVWGSDGLYSFSIITRPTPEPYARICAEMPVLLQAADFPVWLSKKPAGREQLNLLERNLFPPLQYYPVKAEPLREGLNTEAVMAMEHE